MTILVGFWGKGEGERGKKKPLTFTLSVDRKVFQKPYQSLISAWEYNPPKSACNLPFKNFCSGRTSERSLLRKTFWFTDFNNPVFRHGWFLHLSDTFSIILLVGRSSRLKIIFLIDV
ncbi:hypothetical protein COO91_09635 (plasmid) [Nostoc flagelliforme CCNUN1]|uniref:Uncharacterized protein n=1 Tax=Nostoc flagelliforme CCNUN1 TaxID=2038116 RepID=A0A2K8T6Y4_9NOSO|nr:hypothetical protein [Nostoc flagelliforme]AUB43454.1 hypothetical protein COO91_09635 [Nostoc flagelliforme CCNUN1]